NRFSELFPKCCLMRSTEVFAPRDRDSAFFEDLQSFIIRNPGERPADRLKLRNIPLKDLQLRSAPREDTLDNVLDELLAQCHIVVQIGVSHFGLDHPELR